MINLLPPLEKKRILERKRVKRAVAVWILLLLFFVFLGAGLLFVNIYISQKTSNLKSQIQSEEGSLARSGLKDMRQRVSETNKTINQLESFYQKKVYFFDIFRNIAEVMPEDLRLVNISLILDKEKGVVDVSLSGFSPTREDLFELKSNIESKEKFQEASFPPSNWVKPRDIDFFTDFKIPLKEL